jgi:hypothetical protein
MSDGIPESPIASPYRGIRPFRYADRENFYGREKVIEELYANILLYRLVLLFGESGAGKSSVINAGIIPLLQKEGYQAERLRVSPEYENSPILVERMEGDLGEHTSYLPSIFAEDRTKTTEAPERIPCSVDQFFNSVRDAAGSTIPLLIFDQFEELFTLFASKNEEDSGQKMLAQSQILNSIYELAHGHELKVKLLIIIREDFLGKLEIFAKSYPQIFDHRVRLQNLIIEDAKKAITGPFEKSNIFVSRLSDGLADTIVQELSRDDIYGQVHATQLQIVCDRLWQKNAKKRKNITENEFSEEGRVKGLLEGYLTSELEKLAPSQKSQAIQVLGNLITDSETRDIVSEAKLKGFLNAKSERAIDVLLQTLDLLEKQRIINRTTQRGTFYYEIASEYLIPPIKEQKLLLEKEEGRIRQRAWRRKTLVVVIPTTIALMDIASWIFTIWQANQPWGYMTNLSSGSIHDLRGSLISIGRSTEGFKNQINLIPKEISRLHVFVSRELVAVDVRSLNGTTVNAEFLKYGDILKLTDGDVMTLAGMAPFKFTTSPKEIRPQTSAWGMVTDGRSRTANYLAEPEHNLSLGVDGALIVKEGGASGALLSILNGDGRIVIGDVDDSHDLWVTMRAGDYTYISCMVPPGRQFSSFNVENLFNDGRCKVLAGRRDLDDFTRKEHDLFTVTYRYDDTSFQILPIVSDLESSGSAPQ